MDEEGEKEDDRIREILATLKEREKRKITRQLQLGEIDYDPKRDKLVYSDTKEDYQFG